MLVRFYFFCLALSVCLLAFPVLANCVQSDATAGQCSMPAFGGILDGPNIINEQQEEWLGEILAPQIENEFKIVPDPSGDYLRKLAERMLSQLPESRIHYTFTIIDLPDNNAFGIPGGHIYISRRIIALARNEDELAGLLGHEIGHIITRQPAIDLSREFQRVLGLQQLGDRTDVSAQWNRLLDMWATSPNSKANQKQEAKRKDEEQSIADRVALYAMARAGYDPSRYVDFYDRLAQTKGNKGNFWTDLFGRTSPDSRRLRELLKNSVPLMQGCVTKPAGAERTTGFVEWQKAVAASEFASVREEIPGLVSKRALTPPLRSDLRTVHYSPDGKYLLAQDDSSIYLISTDPVSSIFRIDAPDTYPAQFTPDSRALVFYDKELRVQKWDLQGKRIWVHQMALSRRCRQTALSHSGEVLACLDEQFQPVLVDVNSSTVIASGNKLNSMMRFEEMIARLESLRAGSVNLVAMRFSPNDRYFLAGHENTAFAFDLKNRSAVPLPRSVKELTSITFAFLSDEEIAGYMQPKGKSGIFRARFPSGEIQDSIPWSFAWDLAAPDRGNYVLILQEDEPSVIVLNWVTKKRTVMYKKPGFAIYEDRFASETAGGEIGIYQVADNKYVGGLDLPNSPLSYVTVSAFSGDGNWLALSGSTRGAVWDLSRGERTFLTRGFQGAFFSGDQVLAKFPRQGNEAAAVFKMDTKSKTMQNLYSLSGEALTFDGVDSGGAFYWQQGDLILKGSRVFDQKQPRGYLIEALDVRTNKKLWERGFHHSLPYAIHVGSARTVTIVIGNYDDMKEEAKHDPAMGARLNALVDEKRRNASYILEVVEDTTGKELGKLLLDTGNLSFRVLSAAAIGDRVLVTDSEGRTLIYSLATGKQEGTLFGYARAVSPDKSRLVIEDARGKVDMYELATLKLLAHYAFPSRVVDAEFSPNGEILRILTADQMIYALKASLPASSASVN